MSIKKIGPGQANQSLFGTSGSREHGVPREEIGHIDPIRGPKRGKEMTGPRQTMPVPGVTRLACTVYNSLGDSGTTGRNIHAYFHLQIHSRVSCMFRGVPTYRGSIGNWSGQDSRFIFLAVQD
jgi:hypothetical protein